MRVFQVKNYDKGLVDTIEDFSIPENAASASLNWLTKGDHIELTGGYTIIGTEATGTGKITGLHVGELVSGATQAYRTRGKKVEYYSNSTLDWVEISTDILGTAANGEDISFTSYVSQAGYQSWLSSPNSSLFKIMNANPDSYTDMYDSTENFKGYIDAQNSRLHLWNANTFARNYLYGSWKDLQNSTVYTTVAAEAIGGAGATRTGTLAFKGAGAKRTCFNVTFTDGTETFNDNKDGTLTGSAGGTGTINYTSGAYSVTFFVAPGAPVTSTYQWEDSTEKGLADFTFTSPTRSANEGYFLPQNTGGDLLNVLAYRTEFYCIHETNAYLFSMPVDDLNPTNQIFRKKVGMEYWRAAVATGDGIYYIDTSSPAEPRFKLLTLEKTSDQVIPIVISYNIDLTGYNFDYGVGFEFGDYIFFACRTTDSSSNNRIFAYNLIWKSFDVIDYSVSCFADNLGVLWSGDFISNNVQKLFNTYSANGAIINNYWEGALSKLGVEEIKKFKRLTIEGFIEPAQTISVYISYDRGDYVLLGSVIGTGDYVDAGQSIAIGALQIGQEEIGGGSDGTNAFHYMRELRVRSDRFDQAKLKFVATGVGYASISTSVFYDIKTYGQKNILRYRST